MVYCYPNSAKSRDRQSHVCFLHTTYLKALKIKALKCAQQCYMLPLWIRFQSISIAYPKTVLLIVTTWSY